MLQRGQRRTAARVERERGDSSKKTGHPSAPLFCSEGLSRPHLRLFLSPLFCDLFFVPFSFFQVATPPPPLRPPLSVLSHLDCFFRLPSLSALVLFPFLLSAPFRLPPFAASRPALVSRSCRLCLSCKMGFFLPALFVGGLGMTQHLASRELDDLIRQAEQPLFGFWWGVGFGVVVGVWVGCNFASFFRRLKTLSLALCDLAAARGGEDGGRGMRDDASQRDSRERFETATRDASCAP
ncbi:UNVERIFIED_CONTAM: hypothetical protein HHA_320470 [Hammondia hammondi]|eukprot:XP_008888015.1 hypothetical protein HHA_320470 [Hammondia hammondi]